MTTTPGAVQGILGVGARKHSTLQAMAPRRTTTQSTDVRIHPTPLRITLFVYDCFCFCKFTDACTSDCRPARSCLCPSRCDHICCHEGFLWALIPAVIAVEGEGSEVVDAGRGGSWLLHAGRFIEMERCWDSWTSAAQPAVGQLTAAADVACYIWSHWFWTIQATKRVSTTCADVPDVYKVGPESHRSCVCL